MPFSWGSILDLRGGGGIGGALAVEKRWNPNTTPERTTKEEDATVVPTDDDDRGEGLGERETDPMIQRETRW